MAVCLLDAPQKPKPPCGIGGVGGLLHGAGEGRYDVILFWPRQLEGLVERFAELQSRIVPDGSIWR